MIILVGASASGKTEAAKELYHLFEIKKAVTTTTREMRKGEKDGVDYFFVTKEEFRKKIDQGQLVEHACYAGNYYGCGKDQVADNKVLIVEPNGLHSFLSLNDKGIITFFINVSKGVREKRMKIRGDNEADIEKRLASDEEHFSKENVGKVDYVIDADSLTIKEVAERIHSLYLKSLKERN